MASDHENFIYKNFRKNSGGVFLSVNELENDTSGNKESEVCCLLTLMAFVTARKIY